MSKEQPRDKLGRFDFKHESRPANIELQTWFAPQNGTFSECYRNLSPIQIPPIVGTQLKGNDGHYYEVSDYATAFPDEIYPIITSQHTGVEVDADTNLFFDIEKLPEGKLSQAFMNMTEKKEKWYRSSRDFEKEKTSLGVIDCKSPVEDDFWDGTADPREAEVRLVDKDGNMYSTEDDGMPSEYGRLVHKYRMMCYWELQSEIASDDYAYYERQLDSW